ncbi:MAG TPA: dialkylresorcinol condensing enzyme [Ideonella sp.]|uniref:dialkylrecorsinol condensing enzyme n=1 Tax=Ideonella sp. TaxID=1929293 RepID=UPI002E37D972|nr:dialkylrecorsinol condensing enzyme [Ideonella sp.]HEX5682873.1 dialkylresorcinol condensing enzyme [Ideonella sp.]
MISGLPPAQTTSKKILVVQYSQTGQLQAVADELLAPLRADSRFEIHTETLAPLKPFPFPWPFFRFFDAFPESAHMVPPPLKPLSLTGDERFDLVILPYQVWFLAPSQPVTAFLKDPAVRRVLHGTPVVTLIACRNMWLLAQEKLKSLLADAGARLIDNVVLTDPGPTLATFITTPRWLLSGRKGPIWGMSAAGLNEGQIRGARRFGLALRDALAADRERGTAPLLAGLGAVQVDPKLYASEKAGSRSFYLWGHLLRAAGAPGSWQRVPLLALYVTFLVTAIIAVVPLSLAVQALLRPFMGRWLADIQQRFEQPSGSSTERCALYDQ